MVLRASLGKLLLGTDRYVITTAGRFKIRATVAYASRPRMPVLGIRPAYRTESESNARTTNIVSALVSSSAGTSDKHQDTCNRTGVRSWTYSILYIGQANPGNSSVSIFEVIGVI